MVPKYRKTACRNGQSAYKGAKAEKGTNRVQESVDDSLKSVGFRRFNAVKVLPGERVAGDEAGEDVVASEHADNCGRG